MEDRGQEAGHGQGHGDPEGEARGAQAGAHGEAEHQQDVQDRADPGNPADKICVVLPEWKDPVLHVALGSDVSAEILGLLALQQQRRPGAARRGAAQRGHHVLAPPEEPADGADTVEVLVDVLLERLRVLQVVAAPVARASHEVFLVHAREGELLDDALEARHEPPLVRRSAVAIWPNSAKEVVDLENGHGGGHVDAGPLLGEVEVALQCGQKPSHHWQDQEAYLE
mmetsp:Transcript_33410/g.95996  ORF Transcript_33410/g.95996 Transcript_33410/m.95996 type:complete len:226 (-) Transcript_33410:1241-1918(-)